MSTDSGAPRSAAPIHRTPPAAPPRAAVGPPGARSSSRASVSTQSGSRPGSSAGAAPYAHPRHGGAFNEGDECMEEEDPTARVTFEPEGGDQEAERGGRVGHPISAKASIRGAAHAAQATAPAAPPAATAEELLAENLQQRLAAMFLARQGRAPLPSGSGSSIPSPAGGLRVVGLSFIGLLGLDPGLCLDGGALLHAGMSGPRTLLASLLLPVLLNLLTHPTPPDDPSIDSAPLRDRRRAIAIAVAAGAARGRRRPSSSLPSLPLPPPLLFLPLSFLPPLSALTAVSAATALAAEASDGPPPRRCSRCSPYSHHV